jgi:cytidylate kinase
MIITIDGPAGAGKSTVARALARRLGYRYLDTGAMYRTVALAGLRRGVDWQRPEEIARLAGQLTIEVRDAQIFLDGEDVTDEIRSSEVTAVTRFAADNPEVRAHLVQLQRQVAAQQQVVTEGRDQGTVVFPDAGCKIFLTASPEVRAQRRVTDFDARGETRCFDEVLREINRRDTGDATRAVGPLVRAPDAIEVSTDGLTIDQVVDRLEAIVRQCQTNEKPTPA